jgi:hypothetical protein
MDNQSKQEMGELLDFGNRELIAEAAVRITYSPAESVTERPRYQVSVTIDGYHPELDGKVCFLRLATVSGEVFLSLSRPLLSNESVFGTTLLSHVWHSPEWFHSL